MQRASCALFALLPLGYGKPPLFVGGFLLLGFSRRRFVWWFACCSVFRLGALAWAANLKEWLFVVVSGFQEFSPVFSFSDFLLTLLAVWVVCCLFRLVGLARDATLNKRFFVVFYGFREF